jgi:hypothetical protein
VKSRLRVKPIHRKRESLIPVQKRGQLFIGTHNETLPPPGGALSKASYTTVHTML